MPPIYNQIVPKKHCPPGKVLNPKTNRCINIKPTKKKPAIPISKLKTNKNNSLPKSTLMIGSHHNTSLKSDNNNIILKPKVKQTKFKGSIQYIYFGMRYIAEKYKKNTMLGIYLDNKNKLKQFDCFRLNPEVKLDSNQGFLYKTNIVFVCTHKNPKFSVKTDFKLTFPIADNKYREDGDKYFELLKKIRSENSNIQNVICIIYIGHDCLNKIAHANSMIFNLKNMEVERFEPHGDDNLVGPFGKKVKKIYNEFDSRFSKLCKKHNFKYFKPIDYCPRLGNQTIEEQYNGLKKLNTLGPQSITSPTNTKLPTDPGGFCAAWSLWYLDLRLKNPNVERSKLIKQSIEILKRKPIKFRQFIRNYADFITKQR